MAKKSSVPRKTINQSAAQLNGFEITGEYGFTAVCKKCGKKYDVRQGLRITRHWLEHRHEDMKKGSTQNDQDQG